MSAPVGRETPARSVKTHDRKIASLARRPALLPTGHAIYAIKVFDDLDTVLSGDGAFEWEIPIDLDGAVLVGVEAYVTTVSSSGGLLIQVANETDAVDMLSTRIGIDASELNSKDAGTQPVINEANATVAHGDHLRIDVDSAGSGAKGLGVYLEFLPGAIYTVIVEGHTGPAGSDGADGAPGGITDFTGEWDSGTTYTAAQAVSHDGSSYAAIQGSTDVEPGVDAGWEDYWMLLASAAAAGLPESGWADAGETWTYASADDPTYTLTITGDLTSKYSAGMRVRVSQSTGGTKYFIITKVAYSSPNTTLTLFGGSDYDLNNETISSPVYSVVKAPAGFPLDPTKWTVSITDTSNLAQASPANGTWYNLGSLSLSIPIGIWRVFYEVVASTTNTGSDTAITAYTTLSTANNSESDVSMTSVMQTGDANAAGKLITQTHHRERTLVLTAKTSYFLNMMADSGSTSISQRGDIGTTVVRAICAYL